MLKNIQINGLNTHYFVLNPEATKPLIILHGLRGDHQALIEFGKQFAGYRVIIPDLPGHGQSDELSNHTLGSYTEWLLDFIEALDIFGVVLVGHSLGANIAMAAANIDRGKRIAKTILFVMYPKYHTTIYNRGIKALYKTGKILPTGVAEGILQSRPMSFLTIRTMVSTKDKQVAKWIVNDGHRAAQNVSNKVVSEVFEDMEGVDMSRFVDDSVPQLFIITSEDKFSHNNEIRRISEGLEGSELIDIDNLGHLAPLEDPERLVEAIRHWL